MAGLQGAFQLRDFARVRDSRFDEGEQDFSGLPWPQITVSDLDFYYGSHHVLKQISLIVPTRKVTALIGPSGCGKTTFLRILNHMHHTIPQARVEGKIMFGDRDLFSFSSIWLRRHIGMVFQKPNPFPKSIFDNVAYGLRVNSMAKRSEIAEKVELSLRRAALWEEVKDRLHASALGLSGGQQQRLCIARSLAVEPEVLLLDEPCSALDPLSTAKVEDLLFELKDLCTIVIVTHNMLQAARVADYVGFFLSGKLIEFDKARTIYQSPSNKLTEDYITGRFG